ncbi:hypothetical protein LZ30DRAFT_594048 [Colletotrichum cereale]|nr:hypothetical protein LZ30DRAFT_594048 [Colletotrichum cereale]
METDEIARKEQLEESEDSPWRQERVELSKKVQELYDAGCPLFTKSQLASFAEQLAHKSPEFESMDMEGETWCFPVKWDYFQDDETLSINYRPIQRLVIPSPSDRPDELRNPGCSVDVEPTDLPSRMTPDQVVMAVGKIGEAFKEYEKTWEASPQCQELKDILKSVLIPNVINKIICFGLGDLVLDSDDDHNDRYCGENSEDRRHTQHAVALTLSQILGDLTGRKIRCYAQDPAYTQASVEYLKSRNIVVLDDPQGFLDVDEYTLVFSVAPTVPVKQIVTELARPAIIIWDPEVPDEMDRMGWEHIRFPDGDEKWISPWCSDPDSARTRKMEKEEYISHPFPDDWFVIYGTQILIRKASNGKDNAAQCL